VNPPSGPAADRSGVPVPGPSDQQAPAFHASAQLVVTEGRRDVGMCFVGASMMAGYGDPKGLGWVGRVVSRSQHPDLDLTAYNLGLRGDTSAGAMERWRRECEPRWEGRTERRMVLSVGANDIAADLTVARSRLNLANILDEASSLGIATFVVGLPPTRDPDLNIRIAALAEVQADVCGRRGITYVDCFRPLVTHEQWVADLAASSDGVHPGQAGYGLIAWLVLHNGWYDWLQVAPV